MSKDLEIIKKIEAQIGVNLMSLQELDFSKRPGYKLGRKKQVFSLRLSGQPEDFDFSILRELTSLTELYLYYRQIPDISFLTNLTSLTQLDLSNNQISDISNLKDLTGLTHLYLGQNQISDISNLTNLTSLTLLDLSNNQISDISFPKELASLTQLKLSNNQISDISFPKELTSLIQLDLSNNQISDISFPKELTSLTQLKLSNNQISDISFPKELTSLTQLDLSNNQISDISFPKELTSLIQLDLSNNQISDISNLKDLTGLTHLYLGQNQISDISNLKDLTGLAHLYLGQNQISDISNLKDLTSLTQLYLGKNQISDISNLKDLTSLIALDLRHNQITEFPPSMIDVCPEIKWEVGYHGAGLVLEGNPLETPPIEIVRQGQEAVKNYFASIKTEETIRLYEAKLLIVGQGGVGKTNLMNRLIYDNVDPQTVSTKGIDINEWLVETKKSKDFKIHFWDFGGQEIYHATHQFFLTKRSLYLFVWEARTDADLLSFDYWLNTVKVLSDSSPVIVIQNKIDERKKSINLEGWKKRFPNIIDFHDVSAEEGTGATDLRDFIKREICELPHIGDRVAKTWVTIRENLQDLDENYIPYSKYKEICKASGLNEKEAEHLGDYFHDLGVFLHFKDNPILRNIVFLKPEWATSAVYKVTDDKKVKENFGKFHFDDLAKIWKNRKEFPEEKFVDLLELMKSFEICFKLPNRQEYIIPELLRANQPHLEDWNYNNNLRFKYHYDFMPAGVMTRFIVITHDLIDGDLYWKDGLVMQRENTRALVIKTDPRRIEIWVDGDDKKTLLGMIRGHMDEINKPFSNLEVEEMVPCVCKECEKNEEPYFFPYKNLIKARKKGNSQIQCQKNFEDVAIERLISGIEDQDFQKKRKRAEPETRDIKIFLASSGELKKEREQIQLFVGEENTQLRRENIYLDLVVWEQLKQSFHGKRIQDYFNEKMLECDVVIALFFQKVGEFTKEEFDLAYKNLKQRKKPNYLYVYFKDTEIRLREIDKEINKILDLKDQIENGEQIYNYFDSNDNLIRQLQRQLDLIIPEITNT